MRKVETRIKVVTEGDYVRYIPQIKGYNQSKVEWAFYLIPIFGQFFLLVDLYSYVMSFFWQKLEDKCLWYTEIESAKIQIDIFYAEYNKPRPIKYEQQITYIKYPFTILKHG
jgi:hypothetical protein